MCFICMGNIKDAIMCPHCSKIGCNACMTVNGDPAPKSCPQILPPPNPVLGI